MTRWNIVTNGVILIFHIVKVTSQKCSSGIICPDHKPFCTPVGCVFKCPENVFINGSSCVEHCGDNLIYNKVCVPTCPVGHELVEDNIVSISHVFYKLRYCLSKCRDNMYIYNGTCVISCPSLSKFIDNGTCTEQCPPWTNVYRNITVDNELLGIECLSSCENASETLFQDGYFCVAKCQAEHVVFDRQCMIKCPSESTLLLNVTLCAKLGKCDVDWPDQSYCSKVCPDGYFAFTNNCVEVCPDLVKYVYNGTCVKKCPKFYLNESIMANKEMGEINIHECFEECPNPKLTNPSTMECINECPDTLKTFNNTCVSDCPNATYIEYYSGKVLCVQRCDEFVFNRTCVSTCPETFKYVANGHCVERCPDSRPYSNTEHVYYGTKLTCEDKCKFQANNLTYTCENQCSYPTKSYGSYCIVSCLPGTITVTNSDNSEACVDLCTNYYNNGTCVDSCPALVYNNTCVEICPENNRLFDKLCIDKCPNSTCLADDGKTCSKECSYDSFSNSTVYRCPKSLPYRKPSGTGHICAAVCEQHQVLDNSTCINITYCKRAVLSSGRCDDRCPEGKLYLSQTGKFEIGTGYTYQTEDAANDPCVSIGESIFTIFMISVFTVSYAFGMFFFLSTRSVTLRVCKVNKATDFNGESTIKDSGIEEDAQYYETTDDNRPLINMEMSEDLPII